MLGAFKKIFGEYDYKPLIKAINELEPEIERLSDEKLMERGMELKERAVKEEKLDDILPIAFALVREAAKRTLKQRHFDVQLIGGMALHQGKIAEMSTGEGKTLAATLPAYLNALTGKGVHVITVNDYLAKRDAVWMGQIYYALGMTVGCLTHQSSFIYDHQYVAKEEPEELDKARDVLGAFKVVQEFLRPVSRKEVYQTDILYGTNHEFGFDYLRDNLAYRTEEQVQRKHYYAIIDEVDSILIDEARTPLIIAAPDTESSEFYKVFTKIVSYLNENEDYTVDEKLKSVVITDSGITKVEKSLGIKDLYGPENFQLVHYLEESLKAKALFHLDKNYVVKSVPSGGSEIIIVDEFTGRLMPGRRYSGGLHQAIEAKENVKIQQESKTYAQITIQNYFRLYEKISGMTGTAQTSAEEFHKVYNLEVASIPTNRPIIRKDNQDLIYKTKEAKYQAVIEEVRKKYQAGQPILIGTTSIERNELVSNLLKQAGIVHEVLNAKNHEREGEIIAQAGKLKAVTVATNMAGRGVDIVFGGNPAVAEEAQKVRELGGLFVIGTERHEARRIDNQLRGRSGRQGDPGESQFFLSLEDDLLRIFGGERVKRMMEAFNMPEDMPIESGMVSKVVNEAQKKVEGMNFDMRKHLLEYDDVLNKQRTAVYKKRQEILTGDAKDELLNVINNAWPRIEARFAQSDNSKEERNKFLAEIELDKKETLDSCEDFESLFKNKVDSLLDEYAGLMVRGRLLAMIDRLWMTHLENLEDLRDSVRIRAYGQHDPLVEYRKESYHMFQSLLANFDEWVFTDIWKFLGTLTATDKTRTAANGISVDVAKPENPYKNENVGRNDPCPCGSGKKYKKCHGK